MRIGRPGDRTASPGDFGVSRRKVLKGMLGTTLLVVAGAAAAAEDISMPSFESGRYQFTTVRPQIEIPSNSVVWPQRQDDRSVVVSWTADALEFLGDVVRRLPDRAADT